MAEFPRRTGRWTVALSLSASLFFSSMPLAFANPGDIDSINHGADVAGGTYYNTAGHQTTFTNTGNITVGAGTTVRGLEVDGTGNLTNNGGHLHFQTPGTVQIDGTVDARAAMDGSGAFLGNGGTVTINAGALIQGGNILTSGLNGGVIAINVGHLTVNPTARFENFATGANAQPGQINLHSDGPVTIPNGAVIDASGHYIGGYNANVIQISGSMVNLDGVVMANGIGAGAHGGAIGVYGSEIAVGSHGQIQANGAEGGQGGAINIAATSKITTASGAEISANGGHGGNGGAILMGAAVDAKGNPVVITKDIQNDGVITAHGGMATGTLNAGNGGAIGVIASNTLTNNGQIAANGGDANSGNQAGQGGYVGVGSSNTFTNNGQIAANGGNGASGVNAANGGHVLAGSDHNSVNNGVISANGGSGFNGYQPSNGGDGGLVEFKGDTTVNAGHLTANGGDGGTNPTAERGPVVDGQQVSLGQNGGNGGNGGAVLVTHMISNTGTIEVKGGNGGQGQEAIADAAGAHQVALAGNGGNGGYGGLVRFYGIPGQDILNNVNVNGGTGGQGGAAAIKSDCGCATPGSKGACGAPGQIEMIPQKPPVCTGGTCTPPPNSPPPLFPLYPKEYSSLGDTLPPNAGNVLSYTRSIFLARSPLPIIQKKEPVPPPPPPPPAKIMVVKPKPQPKPAQKKVPVRGYW